MTADGWFDPNPPEPSVGDALILALVVAALVVVAFLKN